MSNEQFNYLLLWIAIINGAYTFALGYLIKAWGSLIIEELKPEIIAKAILRTPIK